MSTFPSHISTINTNILGGLNTDIILTPRTFVVGPNGGGKTRITAALGLLLAGQADDILGKEEAVRSSGELLTLAPFADDQLSVTATMVHGDGAKESLSFSIDGSGGTARHPKEQRPEHLTEWSLPVRLVGRALWAGPKTARDFFFPFLAEVSEADILRKIPAEFQSPDQNGGRNPRSVAELQSFTAQAASSARDESQREKMAISLADDAAQGLMPDPTDADLQAVQAVVTETQQILAQVSRAMHGRAAQVEVEQIVASHQSLRAAIAEEEAKMGPMPISPNPQISKITELAKRVVSVLTDWAPLNNPTCPCCGSVQDTAAREAKVAEYNNLIAGIDGQMRGYHEALAQWKRAGEIINQAKQRLKQFEDRAMALKPLLEAAAQEQTGITTEQANARLTGAIEAQQRLNQARTRHQTVRASREQALHAKRMAGWWKEYEAALRTVMAETMAHGAQKFRDTIQKYLPEEYRIVLVLRDGAKDTFRMGLEGTGGVRYALSGAEKTILEFAVSAACLDLLGAKRPKFAVLCPWEERAIDPESGTRIMRALENVPYQTLLYSIVAPSGRTPKGWHVLDLSGKPAKKTRKAADAADKVDAKVESGTENGAEKTENGTSETKQVGWGDAERALQAEIVELRTKDPEGNGFSELFKQFGVAEVDSVGLPFAHARYQTAVESLRSLHAAMKKRVEDLSFEPDDRNADEEYTPSEEPEPQAAPSMVASTVVSTPPPVEAKSALSKMMEMLAGSLAES